MCACSHCAYSYACVLFLFEPLFLHLQKGNDNICSVLLRPVVWFSDTTYLKVRKSLALMNYLYPNHFLVPKGMCGRYVSGEASVPELSMNFLPLKILKVHISQLMPQWIVSFLGASSFLESVRRRCPIVSWVPISRVPTKCYFPQRLEICISFFFLDWWWTRLKVSSTERNCVAPFLWSQESLLHVPPTSVSWMSFSPLETENGIHPLRLISVWGKPWSGSFSSK